MTKHITKSMIPSALTSHRLPPYSFQNLEISKNEWNLTFSKSAIFIIFIHFHYCTKSSKFAIFLYNAEQILTMWNLVVTCVRERQIMWMTRNELFCWFCYDFVFSNCCFCVPEQTVERTSDAMSRMNERYSTQVDRIPLA